MDYKELYNLFKNSTGVTTDSRNCFKGSVFFALKGERFNGNDYAIQSLKDGCICAVVDDKKLDCIPGCFYVPDVLTALQQLALFHRKVSCARIIGITGTNGKTTTKELISAVLSETYKVWYTKGNLNNHIGVPLTLLSMPADTELAVIEMGANHKGEIEFLTSIAQPDFGLITNVGKAHLEGFGSFEGVKATKGELYKFLKDNNAPVFINIDNTHLSQMLGESVTVSYGTNPEGDVIGRYASASPFLEFEWKTKGSSVWYNAKSNLTGLYNFENALAAVTVGVYFNVPPKSINKAISEYKPVNNRSQLTLTARNKVLMDAYNANPSSMMAALSNFKKMEGDNKVLILGGMKELGEDSIEEHKSLIKLILEINFVQCFLVGTEFKNIIPEDNRFIWFESSMILQEYLADNKITNSLILVKGSRSNQLEKILEML